MEIIKKLLKTVLPIGLAAIGTLAVIGGEVDDSPGLGGIGILVIGLSFYLNYKKTK